MDKSEMVARLLQAEGGGRTIICARTKRTADRLGEELRDRGFEARALHGDLNQQMREKALASFRDGRTSVLVATDVAARGIDIDDITHVINYQCPEDEKIYVHRIGRTGRAGRTGIAVTLIDWDDLPRWSLISRSLSLGLEDPPETYSTSPHLFEDLDIPAGTKGRLSRRKPHPGEDSDGGGRSGRRSSEGRSGDRRRSDERGSERRGGESGGGRTRNRRRTRGGQDAESAAQAPASANAGAEGSSSSEGRPRRRRRRRGGSGRSEQSASTATQD